MSLLDFFDNTFTHFKRARNKKEIIKRVVENPTQRNLDVVNLHRLDANNAGDFYCAPHHYFKVLKGKGLDLFDYKREDDSIRDHWHQEITNNALIVGGGGLLNRPGFKPHMQMLEALSGTEKKMAFWGLGHNEKHPKFYGKEIRYNIDSSKFKLFGVRDYGRKELWVPCVSCMHPIFDKNFETVREIGVVFHQKTLKHPKTVDKFKDFESIANDASLENMVELIGSSEAIITNSYHAMYWAMLLNKKVMVIPNSSKFYDFKYKPVFSDFDNFKTDLKKMQSYSGILEECRDVNLKFSEKVFDYLNL